MKSVFVTVGTTRFDALVEAMTSSQAVRWLVDHDYKRLTIQYGRGVRPKLMPTSSSSSSLIITTYDFKPSLQQDMEDADLIVSHAGAGTVMECLRYQKKLVVVINTMLMDNHQTELATAMSDRQYLLMVERVEDLLRLDDDDDGARNKNGIDDDYDCVWSRIEHFVPQPYMDGDDTEFPRILNDFMGFA